MIRHKPKRSRVSASKPEKEGPIPPAKLLPDEERKLVCRVHSGVWGVDLHTLSFEPNIHALVGSIPNGVWIEEDSLVEVVCGPVTLIVTQGDVQKFWEVRIRNASGEMNEAWIPESFLNFPEGEAWI